MKDAKLWAQRDETRFTRQVELTTPNVLVLIPGVVVAGCRSRYGSVLMLALWVSLTRLPRSRSGKVCAEFQKQEKNERPVTCYPRDSTRGRSHQRVLSSPDIQKRCCLFREAAYQRPLPASAHYSRAFRSYDPYPRWAAILSLFVPIIAQRCTSEIHSLSCNCISKRENCVLFSPPGPRIVRPLNLARQSVRVYKLSQDFPCEL